MGKGAQMTYWTILWVTFLGGPFNGESAFMVYSSLEECENALGVISGTVSYDHMLYCEETTTQSSSIRPKRNPRYE